MSASCAFWPYTDVPSRAVDIYGNVAEFLESYNAQTLRDRTLFVLYWFQAELLNGGLVQFYENDSGVLAPEAVEALHLVGLPHLAAVLREANEWFGAEYPRDRNARGAFLGGLGESDPFEQLEDQAAELIYSENGGLEGAALAFAENGI
jgi:hypothetical protein